MKLLIARFRASLHAQLTLHRLNYMWVREPGEELAYLESIKCNMCHKVFYQK